MIFGGFRFRLLRSPFSIFLVRIKHARPQRHLVSIFLGLESAHYSHHVLPADGAFGHLLATGCASTHVSTLEHHTIHWIIHADFTQLRIVHGFFIWKAKGESSIFSCHVSRYVLKYGLNCQVVLESTNATYYEKWVGYFLNVSLQWRPSCWISPINHFKLK